MKWRRSPEVLVRRFSELVPEDPRVSRRQMFGYPCAFVGGTLFMGLHQDAMILRLSDDDRSEFLGLEGAAIFEPMPGGRCGSTSSFPRRCWAGPRRCQDGSDGRLATPLRSRQKRPGAARGRGNATPQHQREPSMRSGGCCSVICGGCACQRAPSLKRGGTSALMRPGASRRRRAYANCDERPR